MGILLEKSAEWFILGMGCKVYFDTMAEPRKWRHGWIEKTVLPAFLAGVWMIAVTPIPPYILQPVRLIVLLSIIATVYYQTGAVQNIILSAFYTAFGWMIEFLIISFIFVLPESCWGLRGSEELISFSILLAMLLFIRFKWKNVLLNRKWEQFAYFPALGLIVIMALNMIMWEEEIRADTRAVIYAGCSILFFAAFYYIRTILEKEAKMQNLLFMQERAKNQMDMYQDMQKNYEQQRRFLHDYKNQLTCIENLISKGEIRETTAYISQLIGSIQKSGDYVNTNHPVVNVILNRKYQAALDQSIVITMQVNDLSKLNLSREDIVTMLVNLLDNSIEACEKLEENRVIQLKMVLEEDQLIFSIKNPVKEKAEIRGKTILTSKGEKSKHGIGLLNVNFVIEKNGGTSVLQCENGWFYFSAMIPN